MAVSLGVMSSELATISAKDRHSHLLLALKLAAADDVPRCQSHAEMSAHWDDISFKVPEHHVPSPLVNTERSLAVLTSISVGSRDNPCRSIGNAQVKHFALLNQDVQAVHHLFN
jgi:hypothetical protein